MPSFLKEPASVTTRMMKNREPKIKNIVEITPEISTGTTIVDPISYKRILNELVTKLCLPPPAYTCVCEKLGTDDDSPVFIAKIEVKISRRKKLVLPGNEANTQKGAEQNAAFQAIMHLRSHFATRNSRVCLVFWIFPPMPWLKINTDGSYLGNGFSGGGYVVRNHYGDVIMAASLPFGVVSSNMEAETKAFIAALDFCKSNPAKNFIIETDLKTIFDSIREKKDIYKGQSTPLLRKAKKIVETHGISVGHIFREANSVADSLARKASVSQQASLYIRADIPLDVKQVVRCLARKTKVPKRDFLYTTTEIPLDIRRLVWQDQMQIPNKRKF